MNKKQARRVVRKLLDIYGFMDDRCKKQRDRKALISLEKAINNIGQNWNLR